ncbi:MAG: D-2-hydroxyacid dehydrogenase family protein [Rhodospirillales bacterium]|nr:D-2-hydroxyacid dehydrogenase family protein [Rhodospirillales bacterium]
MTKRPRSGGTATKLAVLDDYHGAALAMADWSGLSDRCAITVFDDHLADEDALAARLEGFAIICIMRERTPFSSALLARLPQLRLLVTTGMGNRALDLAAATERGVLVCGTRGAPLRTAELTWALILAVARNIVLEDRAIRNGAWGRTIGQDLIGRRLGLVGLGRLGTRVALIGKAFGMEPVAWSENLTPELAEERGARWVDKEALFAESDVVSVHTVLSERTRGLVGAAEIGLMKPDAILVNTSRGPIVDEAALVAALRAGSIAGAGLDVFETEPLAADHPLFALENVVLTPHLGYVTRDTYRVFYGDTVAAVEAYLAGRPIRVLNPEAESRVPEG